MDRLYLMTVFVAVAEAESFSAAARALSMSSPAVTRAITTLEKRLGVRLLTRTTRFVRATDAGLRYLEDARRIIAEADEADEAVSGINATPRGSLMVTAPVLFGRMFVTPVVVEYLRRFPEVNVSALFVDRVVNLIEEGLDVGVRIGHLPDSSLQAIRVGQVRSVLCASPAYLDEAGMPYAPGDLGGHTLIAGSSVSSPVDWKFMNQGQTRSLKVSPRLVVSTIDATVEAACRGLGVARVLSYQIAPLVAAGQLQIVLESFEMPALPIHVIHREGRQSAAKVRSFVDMVVQRLRDDVTLDHSEHQTRQKESSP
jgi:DNA-binding transcriptional LysR family regulator